MARVMYIMWEHEPDIIKAAHGVDTDEEVMLMLAFAAADFFLPRRTLPLDARHFLFLRKERDDAYSSSTAQIPPFALTHKNVRASLPL